MSATDIISVISNEMKKSLCKNIIDRSQKVSIMVDESTSVSNKSVLALYVRTKWPCNTVDQDTSAFSFPLELIELDSLSAQHITEKILSSLNANGFTEAYLTSNFIGACSDGASTMIGKSSGVLTRLKEVFPGIMLWHCMCHRLELAVGDAVKSTKQVNHIQSFLDKLYSVYNLPKAQRELACCASELDIKVKKIGRVLGVRWAASSFRTVEAIWSNYPALVSHCKESIVEFFC